MTTIVSDRIDLRISREEKELMKYASAISGFKSLSKFILFCVTKESNEIIEEHNQVLKSIEDKKIFLEAILNPPAPNSELKKAQMNYLKFLEDGANNTSAGKKARKK